MELSTGRESAREGRGGNIFVVVSRSQVKSASPESERGKIKKEARTFRFGHSDFATKGKLKTKAPSSLRPSSVLQ